MTSKVKQYINDYTRGCSNELSAVEYSDGRKVVEYHEWLTPDQALRAAEIAKEEIIEKACEWIKKKWDVVYTNPIIIDAVIEDFKKAMED